MWRLMYCSRSHSYGPETNLNVISHPGDRRRQCMGMTILALFLHANKNKSNVVLNVVIVG